MEALRDWLSLDLVEGCVPLARSVLGGDDSIAKLGREAIGPGGFVACYKRSKNGQDHVDASFWHRRMEALDEIRRTRGSLWSDEGEPGRKMVALALWAWVPKEDVGRLRSWLRDPPKSRRLRPLCNPRSTNRA